MAYLYMAYLLNAGISVHNLQIILMLFPLKHLKLKVFDELGQQSTSVATVSDIAAKHLALKVYTFGRNLFFGLGFELIKICTAFNWGLSALLQYCYFTL